MKGALVDEIRKAISDARKDQQNKEDLSKMYNTKKNGGTDDMEQSMRLS
jgi:hypothetical protein